VAGTQASAGRFAACMTRLALLGCIAAPILLSACHENREDKAQEAAHDVAMVERMNQVPPVAIDPAPITPRDMKQFGLDRLPCAFVDKSRGLGPLFLGGADEGVLKLDDDLHRLAARSGSAQLPGGGRTTYVGLNGWVDFSRQPDAGTGAGQDNFPARMSLHDAQDRVVFVANGTMHCNPEAAATEPVSSGN